MSSTASLTDRLEPIAGSECPRISVIVPVRNEARSIAGVLGQLRAQNYPPGQFEILVVDGDSTDETRSIAREALAGFENGWVLANPRRWSSAARNIAVRHASGDLLVIVDGHCEIPSRDYLRQLAEAFARTGADCLGRPQPQEGPARTPLARAISVARASRLGHHPASYIYSSQEQVVPAHSVAVAYRRELFTQVGLFDERFDACEDVEFNERVDRAGYRCVLVPELRIGYHPRGSLRGLFRQLFRYGRGRVRLLKKHPRTASPLGFAPAVLLAFWLLGPLAALIWPALAWVVAGVLTCYLGALAAYSTLLAIREREPLLAPRLVAVFLTLHLGAGSGVLWELLRGMPRAETSHTGGAAR